MKRIRPILPLAALLAVLTIAPPGLAGTEAAPEISDIAGDANVANGQGQGPDTNVATAPAQVDSADLRAIWLQTTYEKRIEVVGEDRWVRYDPTGLTVRFKTTAPPKPTFGPSLIYRFPASFGGCQAYVEAWIRGSAPGAVAREYATLNRINDCTGGVTSGLPMSISGNVISVTVPFVQAAGTIEDGMDVGTWVRAHVRVVVGANATYCCTAPVIDEMPLGNGFVVGSDVPADVNCTEQPAHPDCA